MKIQKLEEQQNETLLNEDKWYDARFIDKNGKRIRKYAYLSNDSSTARDQLDKILNGRNIDDYKYAGEFSSVKNRQNIPDGATLIGLHPTATTAIPTSAMINAGQAITDITSGMRSDAHRQVDQIIGGQLGEYYLHHIDGNESNNANSNIAIIPMKTGTITHSQKNSGFVHWALHLFRGRLAKNPSPKYIDFYLLDTAGNLIPKQLKLEIL